MNFRRSRKSNPKPKRIFAIIADHDSPNSVGHAGRFRTLRQAYAWAQDMLNRDIKTFDYESDNFGREVMILKTVDVVHPPNGRYRPRRIR